MHRIDADAHVANMFDEGDPGVPRNPTQVDADWLNAVQEELTTLIEGRGVTLVKGTNTQLATALSTVTRTNATLAANWSASGGSYAPPRYYKNACGEVVLEGMAEHSTDGDSVTIFTLPSGYRPPYVMVFPGILASEEPCYIVVFTTGVVWAKKFASGSAIGTEGIALDSVRFHP